MAENWAKKSYVGYDAPFSDETRWTLDGYAASFFTVAEHFRKLAREAESEGYESKRYYEGYAAALDQAAVDLRDPYERRVRRIDGREAGK